MRLTYYQRKVLTGFCKFRLNPPTWCGFLRNSWRRFLFMGSLFLGLGLLAAWAGGLFITIFCLGALYGMAIIEYRDFKWFRLLWPALAEVLDWKRVEELLESNKPKGKKEGAEPSDSAP